MDRKTSCCSRTCGSTLFQTTPKKEPEPEPAVVSPKKEDVKSSGSGCCYTRTPSLTMTIPKMEPAVVSPKKELNSEAKDVVECTVGDAKAEVEGVAAAEGVKKEEEAANANRAGCGGGGCA